MARFKPLLKTRETVAQKREREAILALNKQRRLEQTAVQTDVMLFAESLRYRRESTSKQLTAFAVSFAQDPARAMQWGNDGVQAAAMDKHLNFVENALANGATLKWAISVLHRDYIDQEPGISSSAMQNIMSDALTKTARRLITEIERALQYRSEAIAALYASEFGG